MSVLSKPETQEAWSDSTKPVDWTEAKAIDKAMPILLSMLAIVCYSNQTY